MRHIFICLSTIGIVFLAVSAVPADTCRVIRHHAVKKVVAVKEAVVAVPVYVPTYQAQYHPPDNSKDLLNQQLLQSIQLLNQRMILLEQRLQGQAQQPPVQGGNTPPVDPFNPKQLNKSSGIELLFQKKCASCHNEAGKKSGGLALVTADGRVTQQACEQTLAIIKQTYAGTMPPKSSGKEALTDEEFQILMQWVEPKKTQRIQK